MLKHCLLTLCCLLPLFAGPAITFEKTEHDFGTVDKGDKVTHEFKFSNSGDAVLEISDVKASCGCTTVKPDKASYQPGESGVIPVTFNSSRFSGNITKTVTVTSNDSSEPKKVLRIKTFIATELDISPNFVSIPDVPRNNDVVTREVRVSSRQLEKLEISDLKSTDAFVKLESIRVNDKEWKIVASVKGSDIPAGRQSAQAQISFKTNGQKVKEGFFRVHARVAQPVQATPRSIFFFNSKKGESRETTITLTPNQNKEFKVLKSESDVAFVSTEVQDDIDGVKKLKVRLTEAAKEGKFQGKITVKTDLDTMPELVIPIRGSVN